jgi:hypothetical protein
MKKILLTAGLATLLMSTNVVADSLKNSLMSAGEKDTPMVNLDNLKSKKKVVKKKSRPDNAVVATINGQNVTKEQTDKYLALRTQGRATDFDKLNKEQRLALVKEMSVPLLAAMKAHKELSVEEKNAALSRLWMQKKISMTKVEDKEAKKAYDKIKAQAKKSKKDAKIPTFEEAKQQIKMQMAQEKVIDALIKEGKVSLK